MSRVSERFLAQAVTGKGAGECEIEAKHAAEAKSSVVEDELGTSGDGSEPKRSRALVEASEMGFEWFGGLVAEGVEGSEFGMLGEFFLELG